MKIYSAPMRRLDSRGAAVVTIEGKRLRCYKGWFLRWYDREATEKKDRRGWTYVGETIGRAKKRRRTLERMEEDGGAIDSVAFGTAVDQFLVWKRGQLAPGAKAPEKCRDEPTRWLSELRRILGHLKEDQEFKGKTLSTLKASDIESYFGRREAGPRTRNIELVILKDLLNWARKHRFVRESPAEELKPWKTPKREPRVLSRDEEARLLRACRDEYQVEGIEGARNVSSTKGGTSAEKGSTWSQSFTPPAWLAPLTTLGLRTALRLGTILSLQWRHVDLRKGAIYLRAEETKNETDLTIPLHVEAHALLRSLRAQAKALPVVPARVLEVCGAPTPDSRAAVARAFSGAVARAEIRPRITFHALRKTAATRMLQGGADIKTVMAIGGWNNPATLIGVYSGASEESKRAAVAKL